MPAEILEKLKFPSEKNGSIQRAVPLAVLKDAVIGSIVSSFYFVNHDTLIDDLAHEFQKNNRILSVGVVDDNGKAIGIIIRRELFDLLGQPFGRDLFKNKTVTKVMSEVRAFSFSKNLFTVSEEISPQLNKTHNTYYILTSNNGSFAGIFSTRDMLIRLSEITTKDIILAKRLQSSVVKEEVYIKRDTFEILGATKMAKGVGGDYYSISNYDKDRWMISICDVSGKGICAALLSTTIGGMTSLYDMKEGPAKFLAKLNAYLASTFESEKFVTGVFLDFNSKNGTLNIFDMGHSYVYIHREGAFRQFNVKNGTIPLGVDTELKPTGYSFSLKKGDLLIIMTDGFDEQTDESGEPFGIKRIAAIINRYRKIGIKIIKDELYREVSDHRESQTQHDDMTMIMLEYQG